MQRDFGTELDMLKAQLDELKRTMENMLANDLPQIVAKSLNEMAAKSQPHARSADMACIADANTDTERESSVPDLDESMLFYSAQYAGAERHFRWDPQARPIEQLLELDSDKANKVLTALSHKQRIDILRSVLKEPLTGPELVERLGMGTTGQLYHHLKALTGADLLVQEERGGTYSVPAHRVLPLLLLLAAATELLDASAYLDMAAVRRNPTGYLGGAAAPTAHDPHALLWAIVDNSVLEHKAGFCSEVALFLNKDGSVTVADNGRGIPVRAFPQGGKPAVQDVLTEIGRPEWSAPYITPGGEKGISAAVVNALSEWLTVEVRREGGVFRQDYRHGIPQTDLLQVGATQETGTSLTFRPDPGIFAAGWDLAAIEQGADALRAAYPGLKVSVRSAA